MRKVLVTGGCGFIGSHLVEFLLSKEKNIKIFVVDNMDSGRIENIVNNKKIEYLFKDVRNLLNCDELIKKLNGVDTIFHLGARARIQPSFHEPSVTLDINARGTSVVCELARILCANVVYAGSSSFYGGVYLNPYSFSKWQGEEVCKMYSEVYGLSTTIARFFNVYGPRHPKSGPYGTVVGVFERQYQNNTPLTITGDGEQRRDFTHVLDIVSGLYAMSLDKHSGDIYNLGTGTNHSINELAALYNTEVAYTPKRRGEAWITLADISKARMELKWEPKHKLENYVRRWLAEQ
jgi:UDP-glucose 4-epimerase